MEGTFMIIAAGVLQVNAITKAKEMGLNVLAIDKNPRAPGAKFCDVFEPIDILDKKNALKVAEKYGVCGVMTVSSDLAVPTVAYVAQELGLVGVSPETADCSTNKRLMRERFRKLDVPSPRFKIVNTKAVLKPAAEEIGLPVMVKTVDSSGSRGVTRVTDFADLDKAFDNSLSFSREKEVIVEEYMEGIEFGAQAFTVDGVTKVLLPHNDQVTDPPYYIPIGHSFPFVYERKNVGEEIFDVCSKGIAALGILQGPTNIDLMLTKAGVKIIEIGPRIGGTCLPELATIYTGIDWIKESIKLALGETPDLTISTKQPTAAYLLTAPQDGTYLGATIPEFPEYKDKIVDISIGVDTNTPVRTFTSGANRIGHVIVKDDSVERAERLCLEVVKKIEIHIK